VATGMGGAGVAGGARSPARQESPESRPVSIMSSPGRRVRNHRVSFGMKGQTDSPPPSAAAQGGPADVGKGVAVGFEGSGIHARLNTSDLLGESLGEIGPVGWTSRTGSVMLHSRDTAGGRDSLFPSEDRDRRSFGTPPSAFGRVAESGEDVRVLHAGDGSSSPPAIKVYQKIEGSQIGGGADVTHPHGADGAHVRVRSDSVVAGNLRGGGQHSVRQSGGAAASIGHARSSAARDVMSGHGLHSDAPEAHANDAHSKRHRSEKTSAHPSLAVPKHPPAWRKGWGVGGGGGEGGAAGNGGRGRRGVGAAGRPAKAGSEQEVFDKHQPVILSASSRLIFYTGPANQQPLPNA